LLARLGAMAILKISFIIVLDDIEFFHHSLTSAEKTLGGAAITFQTI
jgi:hypothetical protein